MHRLFISIFMCRAVLSTDALYSEEFAIHLLTVCCWYSHPLAKKVTTLTTEPQGVHFFITTSDSFFFHCQTFSGLLREQQPITAVNRPGPGRPWTLHQPITEPRINRKLSHSYCTFGQFRALTTPDMSEVRFRLVSAVNSVRFIYFFSQTIYFPRIENHNLTILILSI